MISEVGWHISNTSCMPLCDTSLESEDFSIMLIICRILEHLHDREKTTVIPPFNSPAVFGGSHALAGQSQRLLVGCELRESPAHTK